LEVILRALPSAYWNGQTENSRGPHVFLNRLVWENNGYT